MNTEIPQPEQPPTEIPLTQVPLTEKPKSSFNKFLFPIAGIVILGLVVISIILVPNLGGKNNSVISWMQTENGWKSNTIPPACPNPLLNTPVDLTNVTSILYPGQTRSGNYKAHGGFRFDKAKDSNVTVVAPMDAVIVRGSRYLVSGEIQYTFDFIAPCGIMYRLGHLLVLDPKFQKIADKFPQAMEGDSRTENVKPSVNVKAGETVATAIGTTKGSLNVFVDFGVYDVKTKNQASQSSVWTAQPDHDPELAQHGLCWLDLLPSEDVAKIKNLPGSDQTSGKTSDYCK